MSKSKKLWLEEEVYNNAKTFEKMTKRKKKSKLLNKTSLLEQFSGNQDYLDTVLDTTEHVSIVRWKKTIRDIPKLKVGDLVVIHDDVIKYEKYMGFWKDPGVGVVSYAFDDPIRYPSENHFDWMKRHVVSVYWSKLGTKRLQFNQACRKISR